MMNDTLSKTRSTVPVLLAGAGVAIACSLGGFWWMTRSTGTPVLTTQNDLGISRKLVVDNATPAPPVMKAPAPLVEVRTAYQRGDYRAVEKAATTLVTSAQVSKASHLAVSQAQYLSAFAAARQGDLKTARQRFASLVAEAKAHPEDHRPTDPLLAARAELTRRPVPGVNGPADTLEERAAYQKAVCAFGLKEAGAEAEFVAFMKSYPDSPLVAACIKRIARLHGGDIPKEAEVVWQQSQAIARKHREEQERMASLCGPATLVEVLRRRGGESLSDAVFRKRVEVLARSMGTGQDGTSIASLVAVAKAKGVERAEGVAVTDTGLSELLAQKRTVLALLQERGAGHFVLVERRLPDGSVRVWDSNASGLLVPGVRTLSKREWNALTPTGYAVVL